MPYHGMHWNISTYLVISMTEAKIYGRWACTRYQINHIQAYRVFQDSCPNLKLSLGSSEIRCNQFKSAGYVLYFSTDNSQGHKHQGTLVVRVKSYFSGIQ